MNREKLKVLLPVLIAYSDGATVQVNTGFGAIERWEDAPNPSFALDPKHYRIKPDPRIIYRVEVQKREGNWVTWFSYDSEASAVEAMSELKNVRMKRNDDYKDCRLAKFVEQL